MKRAAIAAVLLAVSLAGCAPRTVAVTAPAVPRHPEFVFPAAESGFPPRVLEEHQAGWYLLQGGDARNAERRFSAALKRTAEFYPAHAGLGYVALSRSEHREALAHFDRALAANPSYAAAHAGKGQTYLALGQRTAALDSFDAALAADPSLSAIRSAADVLRVQGLQGDVAQARKAAASGQLAEARTAYQRALAASPQSPFLHRELAEVERREGDLTAALGHAEKAAALEPSEARNFVVLAGIHEAMGQVEQAAAALSNAIALEPSDELNERLEGLRSKLAFDAMPEEYRAIEQEPSLNRAQLAALIGVRLEPLVKRAGRRSSAVITDSRGSWAQPWILAVTRAGFMEVYPNHTFQPRAIVRRGDLAYTASRVLAVIAAGDPARGSEWRSARPRFTDLPAGHLAYPAAAMAVAAGVLEPLDGGAFRLTQPVSGAEAIAAINRLLDLADTQSR